MNSIDMALVQRGHDGVGEMVDLVEKSCGKVAFLDFLRKRV